MNIRKKTSVTTYSFYTCCENDKIIIIIISKLGKSMEEIFEIQFKIVFQELNILGST